MPLPLGRELYASMSGSLDSSADVKCRPAPQGAVQERRGVGGAKTGGAQLSPGLGLLQRGQRLASRFACIVGGRGNRRRLYVVADHAIFDRAEAANTSLVPVQRTAANRIASVAGEGGQSIDVALQAHHGAESRTENVSGHGASAPEGPG